eukprot:CAMPEP_0184343036 /NCGR_PEP_ID=MMETSP1089-20130417/11590_1 /TAXON_ID=38269 ORGANISM="Gloeochaete wittrockiana, Strain SAG46.84" /NCGR_SAMPLE_ID=MMETSP1089 /ASSEMBLY_ACC=CAM_ASM_000445 /LENGTH=283 /DNA_ID=CAMNT_0026672159 /DNA_START=109 /DNA_END=960 /DNA_ORIENTATION=+
MADSWLKRDVDKKKLPVGVNINTAPRPARLGLGAKPIKQSKEDQAIRQKLTTKKRSSSGPFEAPKTESVFADEDESRSKAFRRKDNREEAKPLPQQVKRKKKKKKNAANEQEQVVAAESTEEQSEEKVEVVVLENEEGEAPQTKRRKKKHAPKEQVEIGGEDQSGKPEEANGEGSDKLEEFIFPPAPSASHASRKGNQQMQPKPDRRRREHVPDSDVHFSDPDKEMPFWKVLRRQGLKTKTRSRQKNIRKDNRPEHLKPKGISNSIDIPTPIAAEADFESNWS